MNKEVVWFKNHTLYERTYGWSWFLKLQHELKDSPLDADHGWSRTLQPLADHLVDSYLSFLPKLVFPVRVGEHSNTAFGLIFPLQYGRGMIIYIKSCHKGGLNLAVIVQL